VQLVRDNRLDDPFVQRRIEQNPYLSSGNNKFIGLPPCLLCVQEE